MAIVKRFVSYKIPENRGYTIIELWESATETGSFALLNSTKYDYPSRATEYDMLDTVKYYKVRFKNVDENRFSPYTDVFFGGHFDDKEGFAQITTSFDGAGYATPTQFYATTNLNSDQIPLSDVQDAMYTARAFMDVLLDDQGPAKYNVNDNTQTSRRKYNAELELTRKAEIYFGAALIYNDMADDKIMAALSGSIATVPQPPDVSGFVGGSGYVASADLSVTDGTVQTLSVGQTSLQTVRDIELSQFNEAKNVNAYQVNVESDIAMAQYNFEKDVAYASYLNGLQTDRNMNEANFFKSTSDSYIIKANAIVQLFQPTSVPLNYGDFTSTQKFINPGDVFAFSASTVTTSGSLFQTNVATLTGIGSGMMHSGYILDNVTVNGVGSSGVTPNESATLIISSTLDVNGVSYFLDSWTDNLGVEQVGRDGNKTSTDGYNIDFNTGQDEVAIRWNNIAASGGFDLVTGDNISFTYTTV